MTATSQSIQYKTFTIEPSELGYRPCFIFYPTDQGPQDDGEYVDDIFRYTGNCKWADSIEDAKDQINDKIAESMPYYTVEMNGRNYPWKWLSDAVGFASKFNGTMNVSFNSI